MKRTALLATAFVLATGAAYAQTPPTAAPASRHAEHREMKAERRADAMADVHTILRIRPEQEQAFEGFAASMQPRPHDPRQEMQEMEQMQTLTTPQMIDRKNARMMARQAESRQREDAVKAFYAALSPEQQQTFDALRRLTMGMGMGGGMHDGHGDHGDHGDMHGGPQG